MKMMVMMMMLPPLDSNVFTYNECIKVNIYFNFLIVLSHFVFHSGQKEKSSIFMQHILLYETGLLLYKDGDLRWRDLEFTKNQKLKVTALFLILHKLI